MHNAYLRLENRFLSITYRKEIRVITRKYTVRSWTIVSYLGKHTFKTGLSAAKNSPCPPMIDGIDTPYALHMVRFSLQESFIKNLFSGFWPKFCNSVGSRSKFVLLVVCNFRKLGGGGRGEGGTWPEVFRKKQNKEMSDSKKAQGKLCLHMLQLL